MQDGKDCVRLTIDLNCTISAVTRGGTYLLLVIEELPDGVPDVLDGGYSPALPSAPKTTPEAGSVGNTF